MYINSGRQRGKFSDGRLGGGGLFQEVPSPRSFLRRGSPVRGRHGFWTCQGIPESGRMPLSCLPVFLNIEKPGIPRKAAVRYWFFLFATPERCFPRCRPPVRCLRIHVYKQWEAAGKVLGGEAWRGRPLSRGAPSKVFPPLSTSPGSRGYFPIPYALQQRATMAAIWSILPSMSAISLNCVRQRSRLWFSR